MAFRSKDMQETVFLLIFSVALIARSVSSQEISPGDQNGYSGLYLDCRCLDATCFCGAPMAFELPGGFKMGASPKLSVEFEPNDGSFTASINNGENSIISQKINARDYPPEICVPVTKIPFLLVCFTFHDMAISGGVVRACVDVEAKIVAPRATIARWPVGCFDGSEQSAHWSGMRYPQIIFPPELAKNSGLPKIPDMPGLPKFGVPMNPSPTPSFPSAAPLVPSFPAVPPSTMYVTANVNGRLDVPTGFPMRVAPFQPTAADSDNPNFGWPIWPTWK